jgi:porphobilinogen synthase
MNLHASNFSCFPSGRPRRLRRDVFTRNLVRENATAHATTVYPVFVLAGSQRHCGRLPRCGELSLDLLLPVAEDAFRQFR